MKKYVVRSKGQAEMVVRVVLRARGAAKDSAHLYVAPDDPLATVAVGSEVEIRVCHRPLKADAK